MEQVPVGGFGQFGEPAFVVHQRCAFNDNGGDLSMCTSVRVHPGYFVQHGRGLYAELLASFTQRSGSTRRAVEGAAMLRLFVAYVHDACVSYKEMGSTGRCTVVSNRE